MGHARISERAVVLVLGAVQFVNILDAMMVMPLGPDFATALAIPMSKLGVLGASYTAAAGVSGLLGAFFLDRFDRRTALAVVMGGLVLATAAGGLSQGMPSLIAARIAAGAFGGPAASLTLSIVADLVALERRGRATGAVMGAFAVASVLGVPAGLELARLGSWRYPFFAVAALGTILVIAALVVMPPVRGHLAGEAKKAPPTPWLDGPAIGAFVATASVTMASFSIVPNLSAYIQYNGDYPRAQLGWLYLVGGLVSFVTMRVAGRLTDRFGSTMVALISTLLFLGVVAAFFLAGAPLLPVLLLFAAFMVLNSTRWVAMTALWTRVPAPAARARFMSAQSSVQHLAAAAGAAIAAQTLSEEPGGALAGMDRVGAFAILLALILPAALRWVERQVRRREVAMGAASGLTPGHA